MQFSKSAIATVLAGVASLASAQYGSGTQGSAEPTATAPAQATGSVEVHVVMVGKGGTVFSPNDIKAKVGDMVQFQFVGGNHSVVQSSFDKPCVPMEGDKQSFFSGYMPMSADTKGMPTFTIMVPDEKPIWFYCSQGKHCEKGMVGAINAASTGKTLQSYTEKAAGVAESEAPSYPEGGSGSNSTTGGTETGATTMATAASTATGSAASGSTAAPTITPGSGSSPAFSSSKLTVLLAALAAIAFLA